MNYWPTGTERQLRAAQLAHDNRAEPEGDEDAGTLLEMIRIAEAYIGRAERAIRAGDMDAAVDLMESAAKELTGEDV